MVELEKMTSNERMCKVFTKFQDSTQKAINNIIKSVSAIESDRLVANAAADIRVSVGNDILLSIFCSIGLDLVLETGHLCREYRIVVKSASAPTFHSGRLSCHAIRLTGAVNVVH
jgi:hypothetical protein